MVPALTCITDLTTSQLQELVGSLGEPDYRARQLQHWVYQRLALSFGDMTDLPQFFRQRLEHEVRLHSLTPVHEQTGQDGTVKTLFALADGKTIESTLMGYPSDFGRARYTVCVSTQVGCPIGCPFCATGRQGFERNLTPGEIIDQVLYFASLLRDRLSEGRNNASMPVSPVTNIVFMGMGEPLANYEALWQAVEILNSPGAFGLAARSMSISTAGLVTQIKRLSQEKLQIGLAVSLHASDNSIRDKLVPINRKYPLEQLIPACRQYCEMTGRRLSFEYALFDGINDSLQDARSLALLVKKMNCHVNLIAANRTTGQTFRSPAKETVIGFERELKRFNIACTLRQPRGLDIDAGCGQLRSRLGKRTESTWSNRISEERY
jgi:23S rRNA (adenine2503-C2)-methyltransferase